MQRPRDPYNAFLDHSDAPVANAQDGPLAGLTLAVKDIFDVAGQRTGCGNPNRLAEAEPAAATAPPIQALLDAGARFVGRTQTDELAFSLMGRNTHFPQPVNPAASDRVTGGSSSGSAAAVAGGLADIAIGSDTGGSIRAPASFCGLIGLRTTHGRISLHGAMPLAPSLDTFGWFAKDAATYGKVGKVLLGEDAHGGRLTRPLEIRGAGDLVTGPAEREEYRRILTQATETIGEIATAPAFAASYDERFGTFRNLLAYEAWASHGEWLSREDRNLGDDIRERFEYGSTLVDDVASRETARRLAFRDELAALLGDDGFLVLPTVAGAAPLRSSSPAELLDYRNRAHRLLCLSGLSGFPQITLPLGKVQGAPFGVSLLGPAGSDMALIRLGTEMLQAAKEP